MKKKTNLKPISKSAKMRLMYKSGGWLTDLGNGIGDTLRNTGAFVADNALSVVGLGNVADNNNWYTNDKSSRGFQNVSKVTNKVAGVAGQVAANAIAPGVGGAALGAIQGTLGGMDQAKTTGRQQPANSWGTAGDVTGALAQTASMFPVYEKGGQLYGIDAANKMFGKVNYPYGVRYGMGGLTYGRGGAIINAERNELIVDPKSNKTIKDLRNLPPHPQDESKIDPRGTIDVSGLEGSIVIPKAGKDGREAWMKAKEANDSRAMNRIKRNLTNKQSDREMAEASEGLDMYKSGGSIHIKPSHRGKFTEYKKRTGKTTEEALHSKDPHVRKMANFAKNASHWKHEDGGMIKKYGGGGPLDNPLSRDDARASGKRGYFGAYDIFGNSFYPDSNGKTVDKWEEIRGPKMYAPDDVQNVYNPYKLPTPAVPSSPTAGASTGRGIVPYNYDEADGTGPSEKRVPFTNVGLNGPDGSGFQSTDPNRFNDRGSMGPDTPFEDAWVNERDWSNVSEASNATPPPAEEPPFVPGPMLTDMINQPNKMNPNGINTPVQVNKFKGTYPSNFNLENPWVRAGVSSVGSLYQLGNALFNKQETPYRENKEGGKAISLMANRRYDVDPRLRANEETYRGGEYALRNSGAQSAGEYRSNLTNYLRNKFTADAQAYTDKNNMDNQYKAEEANTRFMVGSQDRDYQKYVDDMHLRNSAKRQDMIGASLGDLGKNVLLADNDVWRRKNLPYMAEGYNGYGYDPYYNPWTRRQPDNQRTS